MFHVDCRLVWAARREVPGCLVLTCAKGEACFVNPLLPEAERRLVRR